MPVCPVLWSRAARVIFSFGFQKIHEGGKGFHALDGLVVDGQDDVPHLKPGFLEGAFEIQPENGHSLIRL